MVNKTARHAGDCNLIPACNEPNGRCYIGFKMTEYTYTGQVSLHIQVKIMLRRIRMKEKVIYIVEREFLGKLTPVELIERMIRSHRQDVTSDGNGLLKDS